MAPAMSNPKQTCSMHGGQKNSMNQKNLLKIKIEKYLKVPLLLAVFWLIAAGIMFIVSREAGLIMLAFDLIYMVIVLVIYYQKRPDIMAEMVNFSFEQSQIQKELLKDLALPYTLIDLDGRFLSSNQQFYDVIGKEKMHKKSLFQVFPELTKEILPIQTGEASVAILYEERNYRLEMKCVHAKWGDEDDFIDASNSLIAVYLFDDTEIKKYIRENQEQKMAACLIYIDNYEEALESIDEVKESIKAEPIIDTVADAESLFFLPGQPEGIHQVKYQFGEYYISFFFENEILCATSAYYAPIWTDYETND